MSWDFSAVVPTGTYQVLVSVDPGVVPAFGETARVFDLTVDRAMSGVVLDVISNEVKVEGRILVDGLVSDPGRENCQPGQVFTDSSIHFVGADGRTVSRSVRCTSTPGAREFVIDLVPGTYAVWVEGGLHSTTTGGYAGHQVLETGFVVDRPMAGVVFNANTYVVGGTVTVNGGVDGMAAYCAASGAVDRDLFQVVFRGESGDSGSTALGCRNGAYVSTFSAALRPGLYSATVAPYDSVDTLAFAFPRGRVVVARDVVVNRTRADLAFDVSSYLVQGGVRRNGRTPTFSDGTCTAPGAQGQVLATVAFRSEPDDAGVTHDITHRITCEAGSASFVFTERLARGRYRVIVNSGTHRVARGLGLAGSVTLPSLLDVTGPMQDQRYDQLVAAVSGTIQPSGAATQFDPSYCVGVGSLPKGVMTVRLQSETDSETVGVECRNGVLVSSFAANLPLGTYAMYVSSGAAVPGGAPWFGLSNVALPSRSVVITGDVAGLLLDVPLRVVSGRIEFRSEIAAAIQTYCADPNADQRTIASVRFDRFEAASPVHVPLKCRSLSFDATFETRLVPGEFSVTVARGTVAIPGVTNADLSFTAMDRYIVD